MQTGLLLAHSSVTLRICKLAGGKTQTRCAAHLDPISCCLSWHGKLFICFKISLLLILINFLLFFPLVLFILLNFFFLCSAVKQQTFVGPAHDDGCGGGGDGGNPKLPLLSDLI